MTALRLPFTRVAILWPPRLDAALSQPALGRDGHAHLHAWLTQACARGADAVYARVQASPAAADIVAALLAEGAQVLAPANLIDTGLKPLAWHYNAHDLAAAQGRPWPLGAMRGVSCHSSGELDTALAAGFDYAFLSPVFATATHPEAEPLGLEGLARACAGSGMAVVALGGVDVARGEACLQAGAAAWAGIGAFL